MDHFQKAKVRSAVGLTVNAGWFMDVVNASGCCSDGDPTAPRTLRDLEAVLVIIAWTVIVLPCSSFREQPQDQGPRNVPRCDGPPSQGQGTFRSRFNGQRGLGYGCGQCVRVLFGWRPRPLHVPYVTYRSWIRRVREAVLVIIAWTVIELP